MSANSEFNASVFVSEQLSRQLLNAAQDLAHRCVYECASRYNFDAEEAIRFLSLNMAKLERKSQVKVKVAKAPKVSAPKAAFPLPYNGEFNSSFCYALRQNNGLYTQCTGVRKGEADFCKGCASQMQKTGAEVPEYGTIQQRMAVGVLEYVDPKGRKPVAYTKVMKKYKISKEQVLEEGGKLNITINDEHFVEPEESKRGRPKVEKAPKEKGAKGRPKKEKKVLQIEGDDNDDLFATLVAQANTEDNEEEEVVMTAKAKKSIKSDEEKEAERVAKEEKRLAAEAAKAEKEAKLAAEKAEKEAKKEQERIARELKKAEEEAAKKAKEEQRLKEKAEKEAKLAAEKLAKEQAKTQKPVKKATEKVTKKAEEEDEEADVVKKIEFEGKKYLKSKKTGIIYDYNEYVSNGEQVVVGKWNENTNKIELAATEEEEEEYDE